VFFFFFFFDLKIFRVLFISEHMRESVQKALS